MIFYHKLGRGYGEIRTLDLSVTRLEPYHCAITTVQELEILLPEYNGIKWSFLFGLAMRCNKPGLRLKVLAEFQGSI